MSEVGNSENSTAHPEWEENLYNLLAEREAERDFLYAQANQLYDEINEGHSHNPNLHQIQVLGQQEAKYWRMQEQATQAGVTVREVEAAIELAQTGRLSEAEYHRLVDNPSDQPALSKRKQAIKREEEFLKKVGIIDDTNTDSSYLPGFSDSLITDKTNPTRLTTGRHAKNIKTNADSYSAVDEFFYRTADTHGGKVGHGKQRYKKR